MRRLNLKVDALSQKIFNCAKSNQQQAVDQSLESEPDESEDDEETENDSEEDEIFEDDVVSCFFLTMHKCDLLWDKRLKA